MVVAISQIFGPTVQGEGSAAGRHCLFIRTFNCNLECTWCDTPYTWAVTDSKAEKHREGIRYEVNEPKYGRKDLTPAEIGTELRKLWNVEGSPTLIVVSGGEPMMQQVELIPVLSWLRQHGNEIHIETAGTIAPRPSFNQYVDQYNVSPKLSHSGNRTSKRFKPEALRSLKETGKAWFKFVVTSDVHQDLFEVDEIVKTIDIPTQRVMLMPEGKMMTENVLRARTFADEALKRGYGISLRTHILLWGDDPDK